MANFDTKPLLSLCNDEDHYLNCLLQYEKRVAWLPDYKKWVNTHLGQRVLDKLAVTLPEEGKLRVLGVGSGEGAVEYNLLSRILTKHSAIHNSVVEPSKTQIDLYKNLIKERRKELDGVEYNWHAQTLGQYMLSSEESGDKTKFHLISALYCLYYEPDMDAALEYLYSRLEPGGILLTGIETEHCDMIKIEKRFPLAPDDMNQLFHSQDICAYYEKHRIPHIVCNQPDDQREFDITDCFDDASHEGALLLDFLSNVLNFAKSVSPALLSEFRDYLKSLATERDGKVFLYYDSDYIMATKIKPQNAGGPIDLWQAVDKNQVI